MVNGSTEQWGNLESWSPTLFLVAGSLLIVYAALHGIEASTDMVIEPKIFELGYLIGFLGLLGLYPTLADRSPWLTRAGAVAAVLGVVAFSVLTVSNIAELLGIVSGVHPAWYGVFVLLALTGFILGYLAFGVASLRADAQTRTVGFVLLVPGIIVIVMVAHIYAGYASELTAFVISAGEAMAHLAIGSRLRTTTETERQEPSGDSDRELITHD